MIEDRVRDTGLLTFGDVEERLVAAMLICWRQPNRERGWQQLKAVWPDVFRHTALGDWGDTVDGVSNPDLRPASATRADIAEMEEAFGWLDHVDPADRKLIGLAISRLAGGAAQIPWLKLLRPMGLARGAEGLRKRYERAMGAMVRRINGSFAPL